MRHTTVISTIFLSVLFLTTSPSASELEERARIMGKAAEMFRAGQYGEIDRQVARLAETGARTSSGLWQQSIFLAGVLEAVSRARNDEDDLIELENRFLDWARHNPKSSTAHIGYAEALVTHGWFYRGDGPASTVRSPDWILFKSYLKKAQEYMAAHAEVASADPNWYTTMLKIARGQNWSLDDFSALLDQGLNRYPYFYPIYFSAISYLLPKWHGSLEELENFAVAATEFTKKDEGYGIYARIYWFVSEAQYRGTLFHRTKVNWPMMSAGIDDVLARFPDQWNINNFARFACLAGDRGKARQLIGRIRGEPMPEVWSRARNIFEECRRWANS